MPGPTAEAEDLQQPAVKLRGLVPEPNGVLADDVPFGLVVQGPAPSRVAW